MNRKIVSTPLTHTYQGFTSVQHKTRWCCFFRCPSPRTFFWDVLMYLQYLYWRLDLNTIPLLAQPVDLRRVGDLC